MDAAIAHKRCRTVAIATIASGILMACTIVLAIAATNGEPTGNSLLDYFATPWLLLDVGILMALAVGVWRHSRFSAIALFGYFILGKFALMIELGHAPGLLISLGFAWYYWSGIRGSFAWHRIRQEDDPSWKPAPKWGWAMSYAGAFGFIACFGFAATLHMDRDAPAMQVVSNTQIPLHYSSALSQAGVLKSGERMEMFYSEAVFDYRKAGNILTDERVISYETQDDVLQVHSAQYSEVTGIYILSRGNVLEDTLLLITHANPASPSFLMLASTERHGDAAFIDFLERKTGLIAMETGDNEVSRAILGLST